MGIESTIGNFTALAIVAVSDGNKHGPDKREQRDGKKKREREEHPAETHPVPNAEGQMTGKVIDISV